MKIGDKALMKVGAVRNADDRHLNKDPNCRHIVTITAIKIGEASQDCIIDEDSYGWNIEKIDKIITKEEYPEYFL